MKKYIFILLIFHTIIMNAQNYARWIDVDSGLLYIKKNSIDTFFYKKTDEFFIYTNYEYTDSVCIAPDKFPYFIGGINEFKKKFFTIFNYDAYSEEVFTNLLTSRIYIEIIVSKNGEVEKVGIARSYIEELNSDVIELIYKIQGWQAGIYNGKKVKCFYLLYIDF